MVVLRVVRLDAKLDEMSKDEHEIAVATRRTSACVIILEICKRTDTAQTTLSS